MCACRHLCKERLDREKAFGPYLYYFCSDDVYWTLSRADFTSSSALERTVARTYCRGTTTSSCPTAPTLLLVRRESRGAAFSLQHSPDSPHPSRHALLPTRPGTDIPRPSRPDRQTPSTRHTSPTSSLQQQPPLFHPQPLFFPLASPPRSDGPSSTFRYQPRFFKNPLGIARA
jgi:hypothetical protein